MNNGSTSNARITHRSRGGSSTTSQLTVKNIGMAKRTSVALAASLNIAFSGKSDFGILSCNIDRQSSPELARIKEKVKAIPKIEFDTLSKFNQQLRDSNSSLEKYSRELVSQRGFIQNQPVTKQVKEIEQILSWITEQENILGTCGEKLIRHHSSTIDEYILCIERETNNVDSKIRAVRILREKTEYWQGFWDAIQDKLVPNLSEAGAGAPHIQIPLVLIQWVAELIVSGIAYNKSWEREKFLEVLDTWEAMLMRDRKLILETNDAMVMYLESMKKAHGLWTSQVGVIWFIEIEDLGLGGVIVQYDRCLKQLETAGTKLVHSIEPFEQTLIKISPLYTKGISVQRDAKHFCDEVRDISKDIKKLLTAKEIIRDSQQALFEEKVYRLARMIYGHLECMEGICIQWSKSIDPEALSTFLQEGDFNFCSGTGRLINEIESILKDDTRDTKKKKAEKKRSKEDRRFQNWDWNNRPLVTSEGAMEVLKDLNEAIQAIHSISVSIGTGSYMPPIGGTAGEVKRLYEEFNHSNPLLAEFFDALGRAVKQGSIEFPARQEQEITEPKVPRQGLLKRQWHKWRKPKQEARSIGGL